MTLSPWTLASALAAVTATEIGRLVNSERKLDTDVKAPAVQPLGSLRLGSLVIRPSTLTSPEEALTVTAPPLSVAPLPPALPIWIEVLRLMAVRSFRIR